MDRDSLRALEQLNQLRLTDEQALDIMDFFADCEADAANLNAIDTSAVERMVHVMPMVNVLRDDVASQPFSRDDLQEGAPQIMDGYWQVPRVAV